MFLIQLYFLRGTDGWGSPTLPHYMCMLISKHLATEMLKCEEKMCFRIEKMYFASTSNKP